MPDPARREPTRLLFVCLGNICRSPLAEGIFLHRAAERGLAARFAVDSCGTGHWHIGARPDPRALAVAAKYGVDLPSRARQWDGDRDPGAFELILAMDRANRDDLISMAAPPRKLRLMRSFDPALADAGDDALDVPDPYYGADDGFDEVYHMLVRACDGLLDELAAGAIRRG